MNGHAGQLKNPWGKIRKRANLVFNTTQRDIRTGWNIDSSNTRFGCFHFYGFVHFQYSLNYDRSDCGAVILALIGFGWIERVLLPHRGYNPTLDPHSLPFKWISTNWDKYILQFETNTIYYLRQIHFAIWNKYNLLFETNTFGSFRQNIE